jgi:hypothetical protein
MLEVLLPFFILK